MNKRIGEMRMNRYPHMVHEYYVARLRNLSAQRKERLASLRTRKDAELYVADVRRKVRACFSPIPAKTPLNARITGCIETKSHVVEKVVFESRPSFLVTANLYLPKSRKDRLPAVLVFCGHDLAAKAFDPYQRFCLGLVEKGFAVLITDPVAQGERRQYYPADGGRRPGLCQVHNFMGNQQILVDDWLGAWRAWDTVRALDYLLTRPEVDPARVGAAGNSGGGTDTVLLAALDSRVSMVAPSCYVGSWVTNMENELSADAEQFPPDLLGSGLDLADMLLSFAPRPTLICSQYNDFFDVSAARQAAKDIRHVNDLLGAPRTVEFFAGPHGHCYSVESREATYAFFMKHGGIVGSARERQGETMDQRKLFVLPRGETYRSGSVRVFDVTADRARSLAASRPRLALPELRGRAMKLLGVSLPSSPPHARTLRFAAGCHPELNYGNQFAVETEPGIQALVTAFGDGHDWVHPGKGKAMLYLGNTSAGEDVIMIPRIRKLVAGKRVFFAVDPRGIGESRAQTCGSVEFSEVAGSDYLYAATGEMLGESYAGRRVHDVLRCMDLLLSQGVTDIHVVGRGMGSISAAFAALIHPSNPKVTLINYLPSYELLATTPLSCWPLSALVRGCLRHFDLPDLYRVLGSRIRLEEPWGARMNPLPPRQRKMRG